MSIAQWKNENTPQRQQGNMPNFINQCQIGVGDSAYKGDVEPSNIDLYSFNGKRQWGIDTLIASIARSKDERERYKMLNELLGHTRKISDENRKSIFYKEQYEEVKHFLDNSGCLITENVKERDSITKKEEVVGTRVLLKKSLVAYREYLRKN